MKVLFATSEALPFYKSGGLADVSRSLPDALADRGHDVQIIHPLYDSVDRTRLQPGHHNRIEVPWVGGSITLGSLRHEPRNGAPAILLEHPAFHVGASPYEDSDAAATARRFALFARAVLHYAHAWQADIVHLNDWQTGLVPAYALVDDISIPTLFSIHNLAYQGIFTPPVLDQIGIPRTLYRTENGLEFYGNVSYLKGGIALANRIATVSPAYAREIQTPEYGAGFDGLLRFRAHDLFGILNGIDVKAWNPATDTALPHTFDAMTLNLKELARLHLTRAAGFDEALPLLAVVSRFAYQKGIDLILTAVPELLNASINLFVLGDGDASIEAQFAEVARRFPGRIATVCRFDDHLARQLYAGADFFLMPSRYEPCGLGQMIAQRYGTPPIVRATGGLKDTVDDGRTGFCFERASVEDLMVAVNRALAAWRGADWDSLRRRCMALDWSWNQSALHYEDVYAHARGLTRS